MSMCPVEIKQLLKNDVVRATFTDKVRCLIDHTMFALKNESRSPIDYKESVHINL